MEIFLAAKFTGADNREKLEKIRNILTTAGHDVFVGPIDLDDYGKNKMPPSEFMAQTFQQIKKSDIVLIEHEKVSTGAGIEAGFAKALGKQIVTLYPDNAEKSNSLEGVSANIIYYSNLKELETKLKENFK